jgi:hypothetical protein
MRRGTKVVIRNSRTVGKCLDGDHGKIARSHLDMGFFWVTLNKLKRDPVYKTYEFGPFCEKDLEEAR